MTARSLPMSLCKGRLPARIDTCKGMQTYKHTDTITETHTHPGLNVLKESFGN